MRRRGLPNTTAGHLRCIGALRMARFVCLTLLMISTAATAAPVTAVPGAESGRIDDGDRDSLLRRAGRAVLFVPRVVTMVAFAPVRVALFAFERYDLERRYIKLFFDEEEVVGLHPVARIESDYGFTAGARFVHRDLFGAREHLALRGSMGGRFRDRLALTFHTGNRLGEHLRLELTGELDRRPKERFFGIGNVDDAPKTRYRQQLERARAILDVRAEENLHVRTSAALTDLDYGRSDTGPPIDLVYGEPLLTGWTGVRQAYGELELRWDTRRRVSRDSPALISTGELASGFLGRVHRLDAGSDYWRYGLDLQRFHRLGEGPRVVVARLRGEGVTGSLDEVPFTELPELGGRTLLRGYNTDRFRDRVAAVGSFEYRWDLSYRVTGTMFVDVGRVYPSLRDISVEELRVGYGVGIEYQTRTSFLGQLSIASSVDGGVFVNLSFDPVFDLDSRVERR